MDGLHFQCRESQMRVEQIKSAGDNFSYLVLDEASLGAVVIDPGFNAGAIIGMAKEKGVRVRYVLATHHHLDHSAGLAAIKGELGAKVAVHRLSSLERDVAVEDGERLEVGGLSLCMIHTPGHSVDGLSILIDGAVFTGDTLFVGECGRTDIPGGDSLALHGSLFGKLMKLDEGTVVYPGHDYGQRPKSTIGEEKRTNYTLRPRSPEEFVAFMKEP